MITQKELMNVLEYRNDGHMHWIRTGVGRKNKNKSAGFIGPTGRIQITINGKRYLEHRLIWLYFNNNIPLEIDHIDQNPRNNKIDNLREVNRSQNRYNTKSHKGSTSQYVGVSWNKEKKKWRAFITVNGKLKYLGSFENEIDAAERRDEEIIKVGCQYCTLNIKKK